MSKTERPFRHRLRVHWPLGAIVTLFILLALLYSWQTPPFEGPDEAQHFAYIEWLARGNGFPPQGAAAWETPVEQEAGQTPLYYLLASLPARLIGVDDPAVEYRPNPHFTGPFPRYAPDNDNRALHYPDDAQPLRGGWLALYVARLLTAGFTVIFIVAVYGLALQVRPSDIPFATAAAALVALTPQILFIGSMASNDLPAAAFAALTLWALAVLLRRAPHLPAYWPLLIGAGLGLAALAKVNSLVLGAPIGVALLWLWLNRVLTLRQVMRLGLLMVVAFLLVSGWWFARTIWLYGSPLGLETHDLTPWVIDEAEKLASFGARWLQVWRFYWVAMGWGTIQAAGWVYDIIYALTILAGLGLLIGLWRKGRHAAMWRSPVVGILLMLAVAIVGNALFLEVWMRRVIAPYGRLLFPSAPAITILLLLGWRALHPRLPRLPLVLLAVLGILTPFLLLRPAYVPQTVTAAERAQLPPGPGWLFGSAIAEPTAELVRFNPLFSSVQTGWTLPIEVCWDVLDQSATPYTILIHVIGENNSLITNRRSYPGNGLWLTNLWPPGSTICHTMHVPIWGDLGKTGVFDLEIAFLDEATDQRLLTFDAAGNLRPHNFIGKVRIENRLDPPEVINAFPGTGPIHLVSHDLAADAWPAGATMPFTLKWATAVALERDYQVFVHLRDAAGQVVAQADGPPAGGWYPTSWWPVGEVIIDERAFPLSPDLPPGDYQLVVGFYDLESLQPLGEEQRLGSVRITP